MALAPKNMECKLHILVSLRVFGIDSDYICTFRLLLRAVHKEIYKKMP